MGVHPSRGFAFKLQKQSETDKHALPCQNSHVYALWEEENSTEPPGWYLAKVLSVDDQGQARLQYRKGGHTEYINLSGIRWVPAKGNGKCFLPHSCDPPSLKPPPMVYSKPHKVKGYADDLTSISSSPADHQEIITMVDDRCKDICLHVRPDKCYSLIYDGNSGHQKQPYHQCWQRYHH